MLICAGGDIHGARGDQNARQKHHNEKPNFDLELLEICGCSFLICGCA
jgi:hypothetical protein